MIAIFIVIASAISSVFGDVHTRTYTLFPDIFTCTSTSACISTREITYEDQSTRVHLCSSLVFFSQLSSLMFMSWTLDPGLCKFLNQQYDSIFFMKKMDFVDSIVSDDYL